MVIHTIAVIKNLITCWQRWFLIGLMLLLVAVDFTAIVHDTRAAAGHCSDRTRR